MGFPADTILIDTIVYRSALEHTKQTGNRNVHCRDYFRSLGLALVVQTTVLERFHRPLYRLEPTGEGMRHVLYIMPTCVRQEQGKIQRDRC